jgi:hypothetical protein
LASVRDEARQFEAVSLVCGEAGTDVGSDGRQADKRFLVLFFQKKNCLPSFRLPSFLRRFMEAALRVVRATGERGTLP